MDTLNDVWKAVLAICRTKVSEVMYNMWLSPLELVKFENDTVVFCINTDFKKTIIQDKFGDVLRESFEEVMGFPVDIDIIVSEISSGSLFPQPKKQMTPKKLRKRRKKKLLPDTKPIPSTISLWENQITLLTAYVWV